MCSGRDLQAGPLDGRLQDPPEVLQDFSVFKVKTSTDGLQRIILVWVYI